MNKYHILVVEDEKNIRGFMQTILTSNGYAVLTAKTGEEALMMLSSHCPDLVLLDLGLPDTDGQLFIQAVRKWSQVPIIVVSARTHERDKVLSLDLGADDYVTKPFNPVVLGAKVKALIRRSKGASSEKDSIISAGPFRYDTHTLRLYKNGEEIILSSKENAMMKLFIDNINRIFPKDMIYEMIWGESIIDENAIMVYINRLRQKIEDDPSKPVYIQTVRGLGYRFVI